MTTYFATFCTTDLRGVTHDINFMVGAADLAAANAAVEQHMRLYACGTLFAPVLLSLECEMSLAEREQRLLCAHNAYFTKPAVNATIFDAVLSRWLVTYADGSIKYDYECGCFTEPIRQAAELPVRTVRSDP